MAENIIDIRIDLIKTEGRFRKDFGDIPALAENIRAIGLLQPIGIDSGYRLVFGERRLRAFKHLGREAIPARFVNLDSLLSGEYAENEFRKEFTMSERVEIGRALEAELAKRHGGDRKSDQGGKNSTLIDAPEGKTRDLAAKAAGFGNGKTYEQARVVVDAGAPELIEAMDEGVASVSAAAAIADLPKAEQAEIAKQGAKAIKAAAKKAKDKKREGIPTVKPAATVTVLQVINSMDVLLRYAQTIGANAGALADAFLLEVDPANEVIADRLRATVPMMQALGRIAEEMSEHA